jgi:hypothetical protein
MRASLATVALCAISCGSEQAGAPARSAELGATSASATGSSEVPVLAPVRNAEAEALALAPFDPALSDSAERLRRVERAFVLCAAPRVAAMQPADPKAESPPSPSTALLCSRETLSKLHLLRANDWATANGAAAVQEFTWALDYDPDILVAPDEPQAVLQAFASAKAERPARVRRGPVSVSAGKSEQLLGAELDKLTAHLTACYRVGLATQPSLEGQLDLVVRLGQTEGERVSLTGAIEHEGVKRCFADVVRRAMVDRRQGPSFSASFSFTLSRG